MKNFLVYILLFLNSFSSFACGFSPYGEDIRFSLLNPWYYNYKSYQTFYYNAKAFGDIEKEEYDYDSNINDWYVYLGKKVPKEVIHQFVYKESFLEMNQKANNEFVRFLYQSKHTDVISYLNWAKNCEVFTSYYEQNPWERDKDEQQMKQTEFLTKLLGQVKSEKNTYLKRRYAFLAIRLAYYVDNKALIKDLHKRYFANSPKDFLYYWSLYFYCFTDEATSVDLANVMAFSPEKRHAVYYFFRTKFSLTDALTKAKTNAEKANAYGFVSMQNIDYNLANMKQMYQLKPNNEQLDFLLLREISKLEDWIYTPYYTFYSPSVDREMQAYYDENGDFDYEKYEANQKPRDAYSVLIKRAEFKDRAYAKELLLFLKSCDLSKVKDKMLWQSAIVQLQFMTKDFDKCIHSANKFIKTYPNEQATLQIQKLKALSLVAQQAYGKAIIPIEIQSLIQKNKTDVYFVFALARELEYLGNYPDALALLSSLEGVRYESPFLMFWQGQRSKGRGSIVEFNEYFPYIHYMYSSEQIEQVLARIKSKKNSAFEKEIYQNLIHDKNYIEDLLGMTYIRQNRLHEALTVYKNMNQTYWKNNYSAWERDKYDKGSYAFDKNPFYQIHYTPDFVKPKEKIAMTKPAILEQLISYLEQAEDGTNPNRAKCYFYAATCYFNMSQYGNSWMMRRFYFSQYVYDDALYNKYYDDEEEFRHNLFAQKYYHKAYETSKSPKFKALCLRMEGYAKSIGKEEGYDYSAMHKAYPQYYDDLSWCGDWSSYFE